MYIPFIYGTNLRFDLFVGDNSIPGHIFFAHPFSLTMYKMFPYVVLIDSTYKTNKYKMPLIEFVEMTSAGKNFSIAFYFAVREDEVSYTWMLQRLVLLMTRYTEVIVTDNEKALVNALSVVLPSVPYMLCRWHISRNVAAKAMKIINLDKNVAEALVSRWGRIVYALTIEQYQHRVARLEQSYGRNHPF